MNRILLRFGSGRARIARAAAMLGAVASVLFISAPASPCDGCCRKPPQRGPVIGECWTPAPGAPVGAAYRTIAHEEPAARFAAVDLFIDSGDRPLGAYQLEFRTANAGAGAGAVIVGIEGGDAAPFKDAPFYDPAAMRQERVILAAFSTAADLPRGRTRVARIHLMTRADSIPEYQTTLITASTGEGRKFEATLQHEQGAER